MATLSVNNIIKLPRILKFSTLLLILLPCCSVYSEQVSQDWQTSYEKSQGKETATYAEGIAFYKALANHFDTIQMQQFGLTDSGEPLNLVLFSAHRDFDVASNRKKKRSILLINNAIHPGEPDGVDASMMLLRDLAQNKLLLNEKNDILLAIIPFYNIGGALNRNSTTRANQNGPNAYGFRGNAKNYDLNRDFIKSDTINSRSFAQIFHLLDPDFFIDTHVSNGADYPYVMTLAHSQKDKMGGVLGDYIDSIMLPDVYKNMKQEGFETIPYVNAWGSTPDKGWTQFLDWPRYSSGYAALFHTPAIMSETHMLKPYGQRVNSTYALIKVIIEHLSEKGEQLQKLRDKTKRTVKERRDFAISWQVDKNNPSYMEFKGYTPEMITSKVSGQKRLYYNREKPFTKKVPYYNNFKANITIQKPKAYAFSKAWGNIAELMRFNGVVVKTFSEDTSLDVDAYLIQDFETSKRAYEGHYPHSNVKLDTKKQTIAFSKGDYYIETNQSTNRYIIETLEPQAKDSFFNWNFFDTHLQQKEHFSAYVFEDLAEELLKNNPELSKSFNQKKQSDPDFAKDARAQLSYIYKHSPHHESAHMRYPVYRINKM